MWGYILAVAFGLVFVFLLIVGLTNGSEGGGPAPGEEPKRREGPAADEPTPARSATASPDQAEAARRHTPPA
jgi:hypothetical protein